MYLTSFTKWKDDIFESDKADKNSEITLTDIWRGYDVLKFGTRQVSPSSALKQIQKKILIKLNGNPKNKMMKEVFFLICYLVFKLIDLSFRNISLDLFIKNSL